MTATLPDFIVRLRDRLGARVIETHISWVLVAGDFAYKIKKPLRLGFLDFGTPQRRRFCCEEEVRLNRRLAPDIYLDVEAVQEAGLDADGQPLEWAVKMRAFPADATLDRAAVVSTAQIDAIADRIARFHDAAERAPADSPHGTPDSVAAPVQDNFRQIAALRPPHEAEAPLTRLRDWCRGRQQDLAEHFLARKSAGWVRECHGDLHLGNIAWAPRPDGQAGPLIFDCIEFNPALRFIDVISEVAFLVMDLESRGLDGLAWRFLNRWLEHSGDYGGLDALPYYLVYRAMVRAKVNFIRAAQDEPQALSEGLRYLALAERLSRPGRPVLLLMHGVSGAGKSWLAQEALQALGAVRLRSDVERKRLHGLGRLDDSRVVPGGIYDADSGRRTFEHLRRRAAHLLGLGLPVIVDATFLLRAHRQPFVDLAERLGVPWRILDIRAGTDLLRARVAERARRRDDPSEAGLDVLASQMAGREALTAAEAARAVVFRAEAATDWPAQVRDLKQHLQTDVLFPDGQPGS